MNIPGSRDIVQFVKFNDVKQEIEKIAKATLASVPKQVLRKRFILY
jgi:predicted lipoprotein